MALLDSFMGLIRRNKSPDKSVELDDIFEQYQQLYLKSLAIDKSAEFLARIFSDSSFRYQRDNEEIKNDWSYILNVRPNTDDSASRFWQRFIYQLITKNEVLVILSDDNQLLIADSFIRKEYALYDDTFEAVAIKGYQFKRSFKMEEVIYLQYNNNHLGVYLDQLFDDYQQLHNRMVEAISRNNQIRGVLRIKSNSQFHKESTDKMKWYSEKLFSAFKERSVAIVPMNDHVEYEELTNKVGASNLSVDDLKKTRQQFEDDVAGILGIPVALLHGEIAGIEDAQRTFNMYCLGPLIKRVQDELNAKIINQRDFKDGHSITIIGPNKRDIFDLASSIDKLVASGSFNRNEIRKELGFTAIDGGDEFFITKNYQETMKGGETENEKN